MTEKPAPDYSKFPPARLGSRHLPRLFILGGLLCILVWITITGIRIARAASSINQSVARGQALVDQGLTQADPNEVEALILQTHEDISTIKSVAGPFLYIAPAFSWLPRIGPLMENSQTLVEMAEAGSRAAAHAIQASKPALIAIQQQEGGLLASMPEILQTIESGQEEFNQVNQALDEVIDARQRLSNTADLPWRVQQGLQMFDDNISLATDGLILLPLLPEMLGSGGQKNYLVLAQNEDELRPTGGFISGAGLLVVEAGRIVSVDFIDAYAVDNFQRPYELPPQPFRQIMGMDIFLFRDVNFWPSFPYSAQKAMQLYTRGQDVPVDGAVAIDQHFLQILLSVVAPVEVSDLATTVNANNVIAEIRRAWGPGEESGNWVSSRKEFMGSLAGAILLSLERNLSLYDLPELAQIVQKAVEQRHLQIFSPDPNVGSGLAAAGWDGRQQNTAGQDFLLVVDTNLGFNKASAAITKNIDYTVSLDENGGGTGQLAITYDHAEKADDPFCQHGTEYDEMTRYADLIVDCYWNYLRVYVPAGSMLTDASQHPLPAEFLMSGQAWDGYATTISEPESELVTFDNFALVAPGQQLTVDFQYELPLTVTRLANGHLVYALTINKQAGVESQLVQIRVHLPPKSRFIHAFSEPTAVSDQEIMFQIVQDRDLTIEIEYALGG